MTTTNGHDRFAIDWFRVIGSALGAVTAAVVLSTVGAAGTLVGVALGSLGTTVVGALYSHSLERTKKVVVDVKGATHLRTTSAHTTSPEPVRQREPQPVPEPDHPNDSSQTTVGHTLRDLPWKQIIRTTVVVFGVAIAMILVFELSTGRPVSSYTGGSSTTTRGTSIPGFTSQGSNPDVTDPTEPDQQDEPMQQDQPSDQPPDQPPQDEPTGDPAADEPEEPQPAPEAPADPPQPSEQ